MEFGLGIYDGAYQGRLHSHVPFIGCKTLTGIWSTGGTFVCPPLILEGCA